MPVLDFECQLARSQITRYMGGETLSQESLRQLGLHVVECGGCKEFLEGRRQALRTMVESDASEQSKIAHDLLNRSESKKANATKHRNPASSSNATLGHAVVDDHNPRPSVKDQFIAKLTERASEPEITAESTSEVQTKATGNKAMKLVSKPLLLSGLLALVLIGMSYFVESPSNIFGPKALTVSALSPQPKSASNRLQATHSKPDFGPSVSVQTTPPSSPKAYQSTTHPAPIPTKIPPKKTASLKPIVKSKLGVHPIVTPHPQKKVTTRSQKLASRRNLHRHSRLRRGIRRFHKHFAPRRHSHSFIKIYNN